MKVHIVRDGGYDPEDPSTHHDPTLEEGADQDLESVAAAVITLMGWPSRDRAPVWLAEVLRSAGTAAVEQAVVAERKAWQAATGRDSPEEAASPGVCATDRAGPRALYLDHWTITHNETCRFAFLVASKKKASDLESEASRLRATIAHYEK